MRDILESGIAAKQEATHQDLGMTQTSWRMHLGFSDEDRLRQLHAKLSPYPIGDRRCTHDMHHADGADKMVCADAHQLSRLNSEFIMNLEGALITRYQVPPQAVHCIHSRERRMAPWVGEFVRPRPDPLAVNKIHRFAMGDRGLVKATAKIVRDKEERPPMIPFIVCGATDVERGRDQFNLRGGRVVEDKCPGCERMIMACVRVCYFCGAHLE